MTTQTLQQTLINAWHSHASRVVGVSLGFVLLIVSMVTYRNSVVPAGFNHTGGTRATAARAIQAAPALWSTGSVYDGKSHQQARAAASPATHSSPIQSAASSAYNGRRFRTQAPQPHHLVPALMDTGSAYDGH